MRSSISNSNSKGWRTQRSRLVLVLALSIFCIAVFEFALRHGANYQAIRDRKNDENARTAFFYTKANLWGADYDVVFFGDSRTNIGISPKVVSSILHGSKVANFGFPSAGMQRELIRKAVSLLSMQSRFRALVLGITPFSLKKRNSLGYYGKYSKMHYSRYLAAEYFSWLPFLGEGYTLGDVKEAFSSGRHPGIGALQNELMGLNLGKGEGAETLTDLSLQFHDSGWLEVLSDRELPDMKRKVYENLFKEQISQEVVDNLLSLVNELSAQGIAVYGFRPPVSKVIADVENNKSGFDEHVFVGRFERVGGIWLDSCATQKFSTYDGSHLQSYSAQNYSRCIAEALYVSLQHR